MAVLFFDSGIGGAAVLREFLKLRPDAETVYLADNAAMPYGNKSREELVCRGCGLLREMTESEKVEMAVIACNTMTAAAAGKIRKEFAFPVVGIEPAVRPALKKYEGGVCLFGTEFTAGAYVGCGAECVPVPGLAEIAEEIFVSGGKAKDFLPDARKTSLGMEERSGGVYANARDKNMLLAEKCIRDAAERSGIRCDEVKAAVLGCTHYTFVREAFIKVFPGAEIFDGAEGTARQAARIYDALSGKEYILSERIKPENNVNDREKRVMVYRADMEGGHFGEEKYKGRKLRRCGLYLTDYSYKEIQKFMNLFANTLA